MKNCAPMSVCEKNMKAQVSRCEKLVIIDDTLKCKLTNNFHCQHNDTERDMCIFKKPNDTKWKCFDKSNHEIYSNKRGEFNQTDVEYCISVWRMTNFSHTDSGWHISVQDFVTTMDWTTIFCEFVYNINIKIMITWEIVINLPSMHTTTQSRRKRHFLFTNRLKYCFIVIPFSFHRKTRVFHYAHRYIPTECVVGRCCHAMVRPTSAYHYHIMLYQFRCQGIIREYREGCQMICAKHLSWR